MNKLKAGSTINHLYQKDFVNFSFPVPPYPEQQKIASILSIVDELIQKTDEIIRQTQMVKKGLMQKLMTKGIGHSKFIKTRIGMIPETWRVVKLGEALDLCEYGISESLSDQGKYPIFRMNNLENYYMVANDLKFIDLKTETFKKYRLSKGDILFNRTNSYELVGKTGIFYLDGDYTFASYLIRLRTKKNELNPFFINFFLNTEGMQFKFLYLIDQVFPVILLENLFTIRYLDHQ